jgi:hypothetical protein
MNAMPLFKYLSPERVDVIEHLRTRFSPPSVFNDAFELLPEIDFSMYS